MTFVRPACLYILCTTGLCCGQSDAGDWPQLQGGAERSGNRPAERLTTKPELVAAVPMSDAILASPVVAGDSVVVVDGSGVVTALDRQTLQKRWQFHTEGGLGNCNNVSAPALVGGCVHVGTMAGMYYVLDAATGKLIARLDLQEPVLSSPAVSGNRVFVATLGARAFCLSDRGAVIWSWDFVKEVIGFQGDRWKGEEWVAFRGDRVTGGTTLFAPETSA